MQMPNKCPSCGGKIIITRLECAECASTIEGKFTPCPVCTMDPEVRELFDLFMESRGNLKDVQRMLQVSYPTARNKMEQLFNHFDQYREETALSRKDVLKMLKEGKLSVDEAADLLKTAGV
jgi:hypothetical protein